MKIAQSTSKRHEDNIKSDWVVHPEDQPSEIAIRKLIKKKKFIPEEGRESEKDIQFYGRTLHVLRINFEIAKHLAKVRPKTGWKFSSHYMGSYGRICWNEGRDALDAKMKKVRSISLAK